MNTQEILDILNRLYPDAKAELNFNNAYELLIAAILSAQCTDKRVNIVTEKLFSDYKTPKDLANADLGEIESKIKTCGLYHSKAKNIIEACRLIEDKYGGEVPHTMDELISLPGVGRKVANVVLSNAFGIPAIAVDTHVFRVTNRIGLASSKTPLGVEKQLMQAIPKDWWSKAHHLFIFHGRRCCFAQKPNCKECKIKDFCRMFQKSNG